MKRLSLALVTLLAAFAPAAHAFPGHNGAIVYGWSFNNEPEIGPSSHGRSIRTIHPPGTRPRTLRGCNETTGSPAGGDCTLPVYADPAFAPSGKTIAFDAGTSIGLINPRAQGWLRLLPSHGDDGDPAFSPDGERLVLSSGESVQQPDPSRDLWTTDLLVGVTRKLVADGTEPAWSTRDRIVFVRGGDVWRIRPDGSGLRRLTRLGKCSSPTWSPHGTQFAFVRNGRLLVANADGSRVRRVPGVTGAVDVAWSPDGKRFALHEFDSGVRTTRTDGSRSRQLVEGGVNATSSFDANGVDWQPLR